MSYFPQGDVDLIARKGYAGVDGLLDIGKGIAKGALDFYGDKARAEGAAQAYKEQLAMQQGRGGGMPGWVLPAAIVGGAVVLVLVLKKKR